MLVTALCAAAATEASAQVRLAQPGGFGRAAPPAAALPAQGAHVDNRQVHTGPVTSRTHVSVVHATGSIDATSSAQANALSGAAENDAVDLTSIQTATGAVDAATDLAVTGEVQGEVLAHSQAYANRLDAAGYDADVAIDATQTATGDVSATTTISAVDGRMLHGAYAAANAQGNAVLVGGDHTRITGSVDQSRSGRTATHVQSDTRYLPAEATYQALAVGNTTGSNVSYGSQELEIRQRTTGAGTYASAAVSSGNAWDIAARARAAANEVNLQNHGGSLVSTVDQANDAFVRSAVRLNAYDFGRAEAVASGAGNVHNAGNNDAYVDIDNAQVNSGGVEVLATFTGHDGYDAVVGADAMGNQVTGYACSTCEGTLNAVNTQTNSGGVSALANAHTTGTARSIVAGANATGNSASFYVSRPSGGH